MCAPQWALLSSPPGSNLTRCNHQHDTPGVQITVSLRRIAIVSELWIANWASCAVIVQAFLGCVPISKRGLLNLSNLPA
jgi:hypothetical protein